MEKGDFKSWKEAVEFYKEEYKDINLQEFFFRKENEFKNRFNYIKPKQTIIV